MRDLTAFAAYIPVMPHSAMNSYTEVPAPVGPTPKPEISTVDVGVMVVLAVGLVLTGLGSRGR